MELDSDEKGKCMVACVYAVGMAYGTSGGVLTRADDWHSDCIVHAIYQRAVLSKIKSTRRWSTLRYTKR